MATRLQCDGWRVSDSGSIRAPQPTANRARLKYITQTGCAVHGWNIEIRIVDQGAEQSNKRNERRLIVEMFLGRATGRGTIDVVTIITRIDDKRASGEIINNEVTEGGVDGERERV